MPNIIHGGGGSGGYALESSGTISASEASKTSTSVTYNINVTEPSDTSQVEAYWGETVLVKKQGSVPISETDGTVVYRNTTRNAYASTPYSLRFTSGFENTQYIRAFFKTNKGIVYRPSCPYTSFVPSLRTYLMSQERGISHSGFSWSDYTGTDNGTSIRLYNSGIILLYGCFTKSIDVTNLSTISIRGTGTYRYYVSNGNILYKNIFEFGLATTSNKAMNGSFDVYKYTKSQTSGSGSGEKTSSLGNYTIDVSGYTGVVYLGFYYNRGQYLEGEYTITEVSYA